MPRPMRDTGAFWRSQLLSRLDLALQRSGLTQRPAPREPYNLRATARLCRDSASASDPESAMHLLALADELDAEASAKETSAKAFLLGSFEDGRAQ